jgi:hypothetical protein
MSGNTCTNVASRMVEAKGCPGLVDKAQDRRPVEQIFCRNNQWREAPVKQVFWQKVWAVNLRGLHKNPGWD